MSDPKTRLDSLVKDALKEAMEKRKAAAVGASPLVETLSASLTEELAAEKAAKTKAAIVLKPGQKWLSDIVGERVDESQDIPVTCFFEQEWDERVAFTVPEINPAYVIEPQLARTVLLAWELGDKVLMFGPSGAGKSSLIEELCARTNRPFIRINGSGDVDSSMIFGQLTADKGSTVWEDGPVAEAVKYGAVFVWDEWDVFPPEITMGLQWLLEDNGYLVLKEKPGPMKDKRIVPHEHFRLVAIGNTQGQGDENGHHAGTNVQNIATIDRFGTAINVDYLEPKLEEKMLHNKWSSVVSRAAIANMVKLANLVRQGFKAGQINLTMSPRTLFNMCKKMSAGMDVKQAFQATYTNKLNPTQRLVVEELYYKVYGR